MAILNWFIFQNEHIIQGSYFFYIQQFIMKLTKYNLPFYANNMNEKKNPGQENISPTILTHDASDASILLSYIICKYKFHIFYNIFNL